MYEGYQLLGEPTIIQITVNKEVEIISGKLTLDMIKDKFPKAVGLWQYRPVRKIWVGDSDHGSYHPIYGWSQGIIDISDWPDPHLLPRRLEGSSYS